MIFTITYKGEEIGRSMNDLKKKSLLRFIQAEMKLGRTVHITPEKEDLFKPGREEV